MTTKTSSPTHASATRAISSGGAFFKFEQLAKWWRLKQARKAAKKYGLDLSIGCVFDHQLRPYGYPRNGQLIELEMQSGKIGIYRAKITKLWPGSTGQKSWTFEFQGYKQGDT